MKKLMIAAAIVCAAAMSQAATYEWNMIAGEGKELYNFGGEEAGLYTGAAYVFAEESGALQSAFFTALVDGGSIDSLVTTYGGQAITFNAGQTTGKFFTDTELGDDLNFFVVVQDGDHFYLGDSYAASKTTMPGGKDVLADFSYSADPEFSYPAGSGFDTEGSAWYTANAVPEPTSGLLLLLGVAGLALRRRRA